MGSANSVSTTEMVTPRLRPNDVLLASDNPFQSIVYVTRGKGYAQYGGLPFVMTSAFHIDYDEYDTRRKAPWPDRPEETILLKLQLPERQETFPFTAVFFRVSFRTADPVIHPGSHPAAVPPRAGQGTR